MDALKSLWVGSSTFRAAIKELVELPTATLERLKLVLRPTVDLQDSDLSELKLQSSFSLRAIETLRHLVATEPDATAGRAVETLVELMDPVDAATLSDKRQVFEEVLTSTEEYRRYALSERALRTIFPVLEGLATSVDYRLVANEANESGFVPLISARATFDESVGGSEAVSFQMSLETARDVIREIERAVSAAEDVAGEVRGSEVD